MSLLQTLDEFPSNFTCFSSVLKLVEFVVFYYLNTSLIIDIILLSIIYNLKYQ
jgi:hypothetical protein